MLKACYFRDRIVFSGLGAVFGRLCVLILAIFLASPVVHAQEEADLKRLAEELSQLPANKRQMAQRLWQDWSQANLKTVETFLLSESNYNVSRLVQALKNGESPAALNSYLNSMRLNQGTHEKMLLHLIQELRSDPERLDRMLESVEALKEHLQSKKLNFHLGIRAYNGTLLLLDMMAVTYSVHSSNPGQIAQHLENSSSFLTFMFMGVVSTPILREIMTLRVTGRELLHQWKQRRDQRKFVRNLRRHLKELKKDSFVRDLALRHSYLRTDHSEKAAFQQLPVLQEAFMSEIGFLLEQGRLGEEAALEKLRIYDRFIRRIAKILTPLEIQYLSQAFAEGEPGLYFPEHLQLRLAQEIEGFYEDLEASGIDGINSENFNFVSQRVHNLESQYLRETSDSRRSYYINAFGLTVASALLGITASVGNVPVPLDDSLFFGFGEWIRQHREMIHFSVAGVVIAPTLFQVFDVLRLKLRIRRGERTTARRLNQLVSALDIFRRPWMTREMKCKRLLP